LKEKGNKIDRTVPHYEQQRRNSDPETRNHNQKENANPENQIWPINLFGEKILDDIDESIQI
jgi:hypothetical protein